MVGEMNGTAVEAVRGFLDTCYPGWSDAAIAAERGGDEFLAVREAIRAALVDANGAEAALSAAAPLVRDSFPAADMGDTELDQTMGEETASALRAAREALLATFGASDLGAINVARAPGR